MPPAAERTEASGEAVQVPMPDIVRFMRQLSHDLRNHLNAAELQSAYINEIAEDAEVKGEMKRLRAMLSEIGTSLQRVGAGLAQPKLTPIPYDATAFVEDLQQKITAQFPEESATVRWSVTRSNARLNIDPQILPLAFVELFANAFQHGRGTSAIEVTAEVENGDFVYKLREPKTAFDVATENWGREPFRHVAHGHYGLGLHRARSIIEAHDGRLSAHHDPGSSSLITTIVLPVLASR
jgi:K+-sensing histidine kinase KdpD